MRCEPPARGAFRRRRRGRALWPRSFSVVAREHGEQPARNLAPALRETVDVVLQTARAEGIDTQAAKGGAVVVARTPVQLKRAERTRATAIEPGRVRTARGTVRAGVVVRATEAFTALLPGHRRALAPVYSLMIATGPLGDAIPRLPWVAHESPRWEPEPLRWLGVNAGLAAMAGADMEEPLTGHPSLLAGTFGRLTGH